MIILIAILMIVALIGLRLKNDKSFITMDFGSEKMYGHNAGFQLTVTKSGLLTKKK